MGRKSQYHNDMWLFARASQIMAGPAMSQSCHRNKPLLRKMHSVFLYLYPTVMYLLVTLYNVKLLQTDYTELSPLLRNLRCGWMLYLAVSNLCVLYRRNTLMPNMLEYMNGIDDMIPPQKCNKIKVRRLYTFLVLWIIAILMNIMLGPGFAFKNRFFGKIIRGLTLQAHAFAFGFFIYFSTSLSDDMENVRNTINELIKDCEKGHCRNTSPASLLENIRLGHLTLFRHSKNLNKVFGFELMLRTLFTFGITLRFCGLILYSHSPVKRVFSAFNFAFQITALYHSAQLAEKIVTAEKKMANDLFLIKLENYSEDFTEQVELFLNQIRVCPVRLEATSLIEMDAYWPNFIKLSMQVGILLLQFPEVFEAITINTGG